MAISTVRLTRACLLPVFLYSSFILVRPHDLVPGNVGTFARVARVEDGDNNMRILLGACLSAFRWTELGG
ncbi:hypothetical protein VTH06DRAFT_4121 [Thermothelomyces fergusii]